MDNNKGRRFWNWTVPKDGTDGAPNKDRVLFLSGAIAEESWFDDEVTPGVFREELMSGDGPVTVWINSPGGDCIAAAQIYNMLIDYPHDVTVKIDGLAAGVKQVVTTASATAITADELIDLQETIPDVYQDNACWIMNKATRTAIRKLKDNEGRYILNPDATAKWGYTLFGKPVYTTDSVSAIASEKTAIYYGDMSGLAVKTSEDVSIQILNEKYATQHAVGVIAWVEIDAKVENAQKIAALKMKKAGG